jgi:hypothetical protein
MATDAQTLLTEAQCYACYASNPYTLNLLKLALLQQIAAAGGGGGTHYFNLVGTAYIGGDQTGNARGAGALDVQSVRSAATQVASGDNSSAFGYRNTASGYRSVAIGYLNTASNSRSNAFGYFNTASGTYSSAVGYKSTASDQYSSAVGCKNLAMGRYSSAFGYNSTASGLRSSAVGYTNTASDKYSSAVGYTNTASNTHTSAFGYKNTASGQYSSAVGYTNTASNTYSSAFGYNSTASGLRSSAVGYTNTASGHYSSAVGYTAIARIVNTTNICGPQIIRKDAGETLAAAFQSFCGVNTVLMWTEVDLKVADDFVITLPAGCHFYPDECGVIVTSATLVTVQPTVRFGNTGTPAKFLAAAITTTAIVQFDRQRFQTLLSAAGEVTLSAGVTIVATATTMLGRFYMKGLLVEDE